MDEGDCARDSEFSARCLSLRRGARRGQILAPPVGGNPPLRGTLVVLRSTDYQEKEMADGLPTDLAKKLEGLIGRLQNPPNEAQEMTNRLLLIIASELRATRAGSYERALISIGEELDKDKL